MAEQAHPPAHAADGHVEHHGPTPRTYIIIFVVLFFVTAIEVAASFLTNIGFPAWAQIATLLILATFKGVLVVMFYMHLRFDSRWFTSLFVAGFGIAVFMVVVFMLLWAYKATLGGLVV